MMHRSLVIAGLLSTLMCSAQAPPQARPQATLVFEQYRNDWFQGYFAPVTLSQDAAWALLGRGPGSVHLISLSTGNEENARLAGGLDGVDNAAFCGDTPELARLGRRGTEHGWFLPGETEHVSDLPANAELACSADGNKIAYVDPSVPDHGLYVGPRDHYRAYSTPGSVTAMVFSADGELFYYLAQDSKGQSTLSRISVATGETKVIASQLDGAAHGGQIALSPDGKSAYMALVRTKHRTMRCVNNRMPTAGSRYTKWISAQVYFNL